MNKIFYFLLFMLVYLHFNAFSDELYIGSFEYQEYSVISQKAIAKTGQVFFREGIFKGTLDKCKEDTSGEEEREGTSNKKDFAVYSIILFDDSPTPQPLLYFELETNTLTLFLQNVQKYFQWETIATQDNDVLTKDIIQISNVAHSFDTYYKWHTSISDITLQFISQYTNENASSVKTWLVLATDTLFTTSDSSIIFPSIVAILDSTQAQQLLSLFDENKIEEARKKDISCKYR